MAKRHCNKCELPSDICACAEAKAYDKAFPLSLKPSEAKFEPCRCGSGIALPFCCGAIANA